MNRYICPFMIFKGLMASSCSTTPFKLIGKVIIDGQHVNGCDDIHVIVCSVSDNWSASRRLRWPFCSWTIPIKPSMRTLAAVHVTRKIFSKVRVRRRKTRPTSNVYEGKEVGEERKRKVDKVYICVYVCPVPCKTLNHHRPTIFQRQAWRACCINNKWVIRDCLEGFVSCARTIIIRTKKMEGGFQSEHPFLPP